MALAGAVAAAVYLHKQLAAAAAAKIVPGLKASVEDLLIPVAAAAAALESQNCPAPADGAGDAGSLAEEEVRRAMTVESNHLHKHQTTCKYQLVTMYIILGMGVIYLNLEFKRCTLHFSIYQLEI